MHQVARRAQQLEMKPSSEDKKTRSVPDVLGGRRNISTYEQVEHEALMSACSAQSVSKTLHLSCRRVGGPLGNMFYIYIKSPS